MAVPNTNTFSLQDVTTEIYGDTNSGRNLADCFANANANGFDPNYEEDKDSLSNFRNYSSGGLLTVQSAASGFPPISVALVDNESTSNQTLTFTWKYVSQVSDISATLSYNGSSRSVGYTTNVISRSFSGGDFNHPFQISGGNSAQFQFEFTLISATVDRVPSNPNNKTTISRCHNC